MLVEDNLEFAKLVPVWLSAKNEMEPLRHRNTSLREGLDRLAKGGVGLIRGDEDTVMKNKVDELLVNVFIESHEKAPAEIALDLDTQDLPLHAKQE